MEMVSEIKHIYIIYIITKKQNGRHAISRLSFVCHTSWTLLIAYDQLPAGFLVQTLHLGRQCVGENRWMALRLLYNRIPASATCTRAIVMWAMYSLSLCHAMGCLQLQLK